MADTPNAVNGKKFISYVPTNTNMKEFTLRALLIGLVMCAVLGAANAYLGLKAGMTIAATYPAAVIGMALLKIMRGSILVGCCRCHIYYSGICHFTHLEFHIANYVHGVPHGSCTDDSRRCAWNNVRNHSSPRDG